MLLVLTLESEERGLGDTRWSPNACPGGKQAPARRQASFQIKSVSLHPVFYWAVAAQQFTFNGLRQVNGVHDLRLQTCSLDRHTAVRGSGASGTGRHICRDN